MYICNIIAICPRIKHKQECTLCLTWIFYAKISFNIYVFRYTRQLFVGMPVIFADEQQNIIDLLLYKIRIVLVSIR